MIGCSLLSSQSGASLLVDTTLDNDYNSKISIPGRVYLNWKSVAYSQKKNWPFPPLPCNGGKFPALNECPISQVFLGVAISAGRNIEVEMVIDRLIKFNFELKQYSGHGSCGRDPMCPFRSYNSWPMVCRLAKFPQNILHQIK